jgi:integrase
LVGCTEELLAELETMPRIADTIIVGDRGNPVTAASLSRMVRLKLRELGVTGYSIHGLRKNAGNEIAEAGGTEREIMARLGHKTPQMAAPACQSIKISRQRKQFQQNGQGEVRTI